MTCAPTIFDKCCEKTSYIKTHQKLFHPASFREIEKSLIFLQFGLFTVLSKISEGKSLSFWNNYTLIFFNKITIKFQQFYCSNTYTIIVNHNCPENTHLKAND